MKTKCNVFQLCLLGAVLLQAATSGAQPVITSQPVNQPVVWGGNATFSVLATGVGPFTYQWQLNGTNLPNNLITTVAGGYLFNNQQATNTILISPYGVAKDAVGNLFIADTYNNVIRKVDTNGLATIVAGNGLGAYSGDGGPATNAGLSFPKAVIVDSVNNLWIADFARIRQVDTNGFITTVAGNGVSGYGGDNGAATNAQFNGSPFGLCLDATGNLFIADTYNARIRKVATNGIITTVAGNGSAGFGSDGVAATAAYINYPTSMAVDSTNNLFIADSHNNRIRKVNTSGIISTVAGNGTAGYSGDGGAATSAKLNLPVGVALDAAHNLLIVDSGNHCIRKLTNNIITTVAGNGTNGYFGDGGLATNANLSSPQGMVVDNLGNLFIADTGNSRVRQVATNGTITTIAGRMVNDGVVATNATLNSVSGVAFDAVGNLFIADTKNNRIRKVDANGIIATVAGNDVPGYSGDGGAATNANLYQPNYVALDDFGNLILSDTLNNRIRKVDTNGIITTVAGKGLGALGGDNGSATNGSINKPTGITFDAIGNLFISDTSNGRIRKVDTNGIITTALVDSRLLSPYAVIFDSSSNLLVADREDSYVLKMSTSGALSVKAGIRYFSGFSGDGGFATSAQIGVPEGLAIDATGNVFISDIMNGCIRKVNTNGIINTIAKSNLFNPFGMAVDAGGNVYFADQSNNRVRKVAYVDYADQPSFTVTNVPPGSLSNYYSVIITSASGSVTSSVATVSLQLPPVTAAFTASNGLCTFTWSAVSNLTYQLQCATNLVAPVWLDLGSPITATNNSVSATDAAGADGQRFYRVRLWP